MPEFEGNYGRKQGRKREYAFRASYGMVEDVLHWSAVVICEDSLKGRPRGTIVLKVSTPDAQRRWVEDMVCGAIEALREVAE